jgi:peroxiredoxin
MKKIQFLSLAALALFAMSCGEAETKDTENTEEKTEEVTTQVEDETEDDMTPVGYKIGDTATDFNLMNVDGNMVSLANYPDAKGFIVIFTCNHCPFSIAYEDRINALDSMYKPLGYPVIAINPNDPAVNADDSYELMKVRATEKNFSFPYLFDEGQLIYPQYGATKTPHVFLLNKGEGRLVVRYIGAIDNNHEDPNDVSERYVEDAVNSLLADEPIAVESTVAIGCGIKAKK